MGAARCSISVNGSPSNRTAARSRTSRLPPPPWLPWPRNRSNIPHHHRSRSWRSKCRDGKSDDGGGLDEDWVSSPSASPYQVLGLDPTCCSPAQLKAAFRARVKEFHPDVCKDMKDADALIKRVIWAYEILSKDQPDEPFRRPGVDPFDEPECEAYDLFINEFQCVGKGCPYSCVKRAPHAFSFSPENATARVISQGHSDDYLVQLAVGQCPRNCIHYVTPSQREVLEDLLQSALAAPYDIAEAALLDSLIAKAKFENNRYQKPKRKPKVSTEYVDWV
ncbi:unnamed protein product [Musa acuminata subsp. malaccensis]|uniref:(wild Malaysian banana) hypothetical protein n=1 Tax=Musa acuminata subsp. malaccensis TaxID=214687 RepID=A0A804KK87_MUSAM|nr:PREDICTED: uncharacterized protein LOC103998234 [Musa acuminata subsp. malaccensis]CAG1835380.1 unnamed protein product [Musa acuminata subsp. malaccensis]